MSRIAGADRACSRHETTQPKVREADEHSQERQQKPSAPGPGARQSGAQQGEETADKANPTAHAQHRECGAKGPDADTVPQAGEGENNDTKDRDQCTEYGCDGQPSPNGGAGSRKPPIHPSRGEAIKALSGRVHRARPPSHGLETHPESRRTGQ